MWPKNSFGFFKSSAGAVSFFTHFSAAALGHVAGTIIHDGIKVLREDKETNSPTYRK